MSSSAAPPPPQPPRAVNVDPPEFDASDFEPLTLTDVLFNISFGLLLRCVSIGQRAPFDRLGFLLQVRNELKRQRKLPAADDYSSIQSCVATCYRKQGVLGFWRGLRLRCTALLPLVVVNNFSNSLAPGVFLAFNSVAPEIPSLIAANCLTYCCVALVAHPVEVIQLRIACELCTAADEAEVPEEERVDGAVSFLKRVCRVEGPLALWRGFATSLITAGAGNVIFFIIADRFHALFPRFLTSRLREGLAMFFIVTLSNMLIYPLDTIRRRMMLTVGAESKYRYNTFGEIIAQMSSEPGGLLATAYAGARFSLLRGLTSFAWGFAKMKLFPPSEME